ncbi:MAG: class I SAM-dependent methyltransferase, partial [Armatimonadetes bacterium]
MIDPIFADPRLAAIYDDIEGPRRALDHYEAIVQSFGASRVLDVGCGTGEFACRLARSGLTVIGVDPAAASLDIARTKRHAERVTWVHGYVTDLPEISVDVVTMTGNVAQVFVDDEAWHSALVRIRGAVRRRGRLLLETRNPACQEWKAWTRERTIRTERTVSGLVEYWVELMAVDLPLVSFRWTFRFLDTGAEVVSDSTLRFRDREEMAVSLSESGFVVEEIQEAPDRPGHELV